MTKFIAEYKKDAHSPVKRIEFEMHEHLTLTEICEAFEDFLRGCGYHFDGNIAIIEEDEEDYGTEGK